MANLSSVDRDDTSRPVGALAPDPPARVRLAAIFLPFLRLGLTAFGGPAMVAYIKDLAVGRKAWLDEKSFRVGVALCQTIPGATAMQTAAYVGLRLRGIPGGLAAYVGFGLPAFLLMLVLTIAYQHARDFALTLSLFNGLRVIVVAIVANAAVNFGRSSVKSRRDAMLAGLAAVALAADLLGARISPILVIVAAAALGCLLLAGEGQGAAGAPAPKAGDARPALLLLAAVAGALALLAAASPPLLDLALTMLRIDLFAFGGGFGSVPLMQHEVVSVKGWMAAREFIDGIALGQVTPGPIVITATFVGYLLHGLPGALVGTVSVFTPSFLILALLLPVYDRLLAAPLFRKAMRGALLAFVGLLAATTIRFGLAAAWSMPAVLLAAAAFVALRRGIAITWVVLAGGLLSALLL